MQLEVGVNGAGLAGVYCDLASLRPNVFLRGGARRGGDLRGVLVAVGDAIPRSYVDVRTLTPRHFFIFHPLVEPELPKDQIIFESPSIAKK